MRVHVIPVGSLTIVWHFLYSFGQKFFMNDMHPCKILVWLTFHGFCIELFAQLDAVFAVFLLACAGVWVFVGFCLFFSCLSPCGSRATVVGGVACRPSVLDLVFCSINDELRW